MKYIISAVAITVLSGCTSIAGNSVYPVTRNSPTSEAQFTLTKVSRKIIERTDIAGGSEELRLMLIDFPPEFSSVPHTHPVVGLCYIIEGVAESQYEGEDLKTLHAGDSYQDSATKKHLLFRNASKTYALKFTCAAKIKKGQEFMQPL
ncbi:MAG: cupin domain-containing protein [Methylovulum sp.]|nr:cupin domain-containing protein [Methylovulum sp.]